MKRMICIFSLLVAFCQAGAQDFYHFKTGNEQGFSIENSSKSALSLHFSIAELGLTDTERDGAKGQEIIMEGCFASNQEGLPNLPFVNQYVAVPRGAKVSIEVKEKGSKTLEGVELLPAAPLQLNGEDKRPALHWDMSVFGNDAPYPTECVTIAQTTQIRNLDVAMISVTPFRYNPVRKTLEVIYDMDIEVRFEGGDGQFGDPRYRNPAWDHILRNLVINSDMLPEAHYYDFLNEAIRNREEGCEYLIIVPDDSVYMAWADTLKQFRSHQGIVTKVVTTTDCGSNEAEDIRNYVLNAYNNWTIPPAAVLLFGGNNKWYPDFGLKPFIYTMPHNDWEVYRYPTDNPIADMNGDSIPDLAISRLVAYDANECQTLVQKCIDYELNPPTDPHYYDHPVITSGYEADKWFMITSQITNNFLRDRRGKHPSNLYMKYYWVDGDPTPPDSIWSTDEHTATALNYFGSNGTGYIPLSLSGLDQWIDEFGDTQLLTDAINEDGFLTFFRDHSNRELWACPYFTIEHIRQLQNTLPTFVFSIGCLTSDYWHAQGDGFSELFCKTDAGAIGVIGASSVTYSQYNDLITWGMFDHLWPDFMPTLGTQSQPEHNYPSFSLVAGKLFLSQQTFRPYWTEGIHRTLNLFSYLGDTYLDLFTEVPKPLEVTAAAFHRESRPHYTVTAEEGALICITKGDDILYLAESTGLAQSFALPDLVAGDRFNVTVTKPQHIRFQRNVTVIPASGPYMVLESYTFRDESGNDTLEFGERAYIDVALYNPGVDVAENTEIQLVCESPFVEILQGTAVCPRLEHNGRTTLSNAFLIKITDDVPDQTKIALQIILDNGTVIQNIDFQRIVSASSLFIKPTFTILTGDQERTTHILNEGRTEITFQFGNNGHCGSGPVQARIEVLAPFIIVETSHLFIENLPPDSIFTLTFPLETLPNDISGAWIKMRFTISNGIHEATYEPTVQYGGIFEDFETDTLNPFFTWENTVQYPWVYSEADAAQGRRCFEVTPPKNKPSRLLLKTEGYIPQGKMSFFVKTGRYASNALETLTIKEITNSGTKTQTFSSEEWRYWEATVFPECTTLDFEFQMHGEEGFGIRIDSLCFPPQHLPIAFAGNDLISGKEAAVELKGAYAYDCDAVRWTTDGDGHFENDTLINAVYYPGNQDMANGEVTLTLHATDSVNAMSSSLTLTLLDDLRFLGAIIGDSIVNQYETQISHYSIENQEGIRYVWQLEPATAGIIYDYGNEVDILWNLHESEAEALLSVTADNGCDLEPIIKIINLIGHSTPEWHSPDFDLYPNPTDGKLNLVLDEGLGEKATIEVYNLLGEKMLSQQTRHLRQGETISLDLSRMVSGLYIIKLSTENGSCSKKVSVRSQLLESNFYFCRK